MRSTLYRLIIIIIIFASCAGKGLTKILNNDNKAIIKTVLIIEESATVDPYFNIMLENGVVSFYDENNYSKFDTTDDIYKIIKVSSQYEAKTVLEGLSSSAYADMIVVSGHGFAYVLDKVAAKYPNQKYAFLDDNIELNASNISKITLDEHINGYMAGTAIAIKAKHENIDNYNFGFIANFPNKAVDRYLAGYIQGIINILPKANFYTAYSKTNDISKKSYYLANKMYGELDVYAILSVAEVANIGVIEQAKNYAREGKSAWVLAVSNSNQHDAGIFEINENSVVFTTFIKPIDSAVKAFLTNFSKGFFSDTQLKHYFLYSMIFYTIDNIAFDIGIKKYLKTTEENIYNSNIRISENLDQSIAITILE